MEYTEGEWRAYCLGSEGYQVRRNTKNMPLPKTKEEVKERLTIIVERMGGSFETQKANANFIAASRGLYEACKELDQWLMDNLSNYEDNGALHILQIHLQNQLAKAEGK